MLLSMVTSGGPCAFAAPDLTAPDLAAPERPNAFAPLRTLLAGWELTTEFAFSVGTSEGERFRYEGGSMTMHTLVPTASTSKWPSAMMFAGLVADGTIASLDTRVNTILPYWTKDASDPRSAITLRMLLTFTSGFGDGHPGLESNTRAARAWRAAHPAELARANASRTELDQSAACNAVIGSNTRCGRWIYEHVKLIGTPGAVYSYNSNHLQIAAAVAVTATGLPIHEFTQRYLLGPYGMRHSYYKGNCPDFAGSLMTTGEDYGRFLHGILTYKVLPREIIEQSERDATPFLEANNQLYGHYGFGHFLMCFDMAAGFTRACTEARSHMDPGAFGFIPILDRKNGYYMQVVAAETAPTGEYALSGIPEYLAVAAKPHVEAIVAGRTGPTAAAEHAHHDILSLSVADVNYVVDCKLHPAHCAV